MVYLGVFSIYQISLRLEKPDKILYNFKKYEILKYSLFIWTIGTSDEDCTQRWEFYPCRAAGRR